MIKNNKKKLLMFGTSKGSCEMIEYAKSIGLHTIVTDPNEPAKSKAKSISDEYWITDTSDIDLLEAKCKEEKIDVLSRINSFYNSIFIDKSMKLIFKV